MNRDVYPTLVVYVQCLLFITPVYNYKCQTFLQLYSDYVMYYKPSLKHYYYFRVCSNKYYCLLKKKEKNRDVYPTLVVCVQCLLFIIPVYNYKDQTILQLYSGYVMYYKYGLKHYYYFHVCSNEYYYLLKKKKKTITNFFLLNSLYIYMCVCVCKENMENCGLIIIL